MNSKPNSRSRVIITLLLTVVFLIGVTSCQKKGTWTVEEQQLIETYSNQIMPLCVVDETNDSLFLRKECQSLSHEDVKDSLFVKLKQQMLLTVNNPENEGVGIAAPQVGISRRLVAVQRFDKEGTPFELYINPTFVYLSDEKREGWEGCLSVPGKQGKVERSSWLVISYNDEKTFEIHNDTVKGFTAVIFQHEVDHLNGILYTDRSSELKIK
ncbi:MAG: peptide deformylase [Bacteroidaceae bacterium]|nr:peptide deformylase [Bacteroidaceae bacterium]